MQVSTEAIGGVCAAESVTRPSGGERTRPLPIFLEAVRRRDPALATHGESVGHHAAAVAETLGFPPPEVGWLRLAGVLHDIGKLSIPVAVREKPGPLDDFEWEIMRRHPEIGARLVRSAGLEQVAAWVETHHERPDGGGYPFGLTEAEIPLEGQILGAVDAFHAMTSDRPYRRALSLAEAADEMRACAGTQFSAALVDPVLESAFGAPPAELEDMRRIA